MPDTRQDRPGGKSGAGPKWFLTSVLPSWEGGVPGVIPGAGKYTTKVALPLAKSLFSKRDSNQSEHELKMNLDVKFAPNLLIFGEKILKMKL
jgi:hypothetical protein